MKRHEWDRRNYRNSRDLDHLTAEELSERFHDCLNNNCVRSVHGKVGFLPTTKPLGELWMTLSTEIFEECHLRGYPYPGPINISGFHSMERIANPIPDMEALLSNLGVSEKPFLMKFGDPQWLQPSLEHGRFRVASASYYDSVAHNHARRDSERHRYFRLNPRNKQFAKFQHSWSPDTGQLGDSWGRISSPTDYFLLSMSGSYSSRLFGDFASESCLVIHEPKKFIDRAVHAIARKMQGWRVKVAVVTYYDPVRVDPNTIDVFTFKPFRHTYQNEIRIVCVPPTQVDCLSPIEIELGSLADCATIVDHSTHPPIIVHDPFDDPVTHGTRAPEGTMVRELPDVARMEGFTLHRVGDPKTDWYFQIQYTDKDGNWQQVKVPMLDGLYLLNLLRAAEKDQRLDLWNRGGANPSAG